VVPRTVSPAASVTSSPWLVLAVPPAVTALLEFLGGQRLGGQPGIVLVLRADLHVDVADDPDFAALGLALTGEHLDQLALAVAGNPGNADDLAAAHGQRDIVDRNRAGIVQRAHVR